MVRGVMVPVILALDDQVLLSMETVEVGKVYFSREELRRLKMRQLGFD